MAEEAQCDHGVEGVEIPVGLIFGLRYKYELQCDHAIEGVEMLPPPTAPPSASGFNVTTPLKAWNGGQPRSRAPCFRASM